MSNLRLTNDAATLDHDRFQQSLCRLFEPPCGTAAVSMQAEAGSAIISLRIRFEHGGPTIPHMRGRLVDASLVGEALAPDFTLALPYQVDLREDVQHRSNAALVLQLESIKAVRAHRPAL